MIKYIPGCLQGRYADPKVHEALLELIRIHQNRANARLHHVRWQDGLRPLFHVSYDTGPLGQHYFHTAFSEHEVHAKMTHWTMTYDPFNLPLDTNSTIINFDDTVGIWDDTTEPNGIDTTKKSVGPGGANINAGQRGNQSALDVCGYARWQKLLSLDAADQAYVERHSTYGGGYDRALEERRAKALRTWQRYSREHHYCHKNNQLTLEWKNFEAGFICKECEKTLAKG